MNTLQGKHFMILGAGPFQTPAIRTAAKLGCHVVTVDYLPDNVGHRHAHQYVNCSTVEMHCVLRAAENLAIDGICTFSSDVAVPTVAHVCERLGLPGASLAVAETLSAKHRFRAFLEDAGLFRPAFVSGSDYATIAGAVQRLAPPIMFKPVDASGSRGITRVDRIEFPACHAAFLMAQAHSRTKTVVVEEFVAGTEVGGDAILANGRIAFVAITHKHLNGFVVRGHSLPCNLPPADQARVIEHIEAVCTALGYRDGPLNFDAIVAYDKVALLELSPRNGGNGIPAVIERATGFNVERAAIQLALGVVPDFPERAVIESGVGSFVFGSRIGGRLARIRPAAELRRLVPEVFAVHYARQVGDDVSPFEHNGNLIGYTLFDCRDAADYERVTEKISDSLDISINPG